MPKDNVIKFPKNFETLIDQGNHFFDESKWHQAYECYYQAYELRPVFSLNYLLSVLLSKMGEIDEALALTKEYSEEYLQHGSECTFYYLQLLVRHRDFILARRDLKNLRSAKLVNVLTAYIQMQEQKMMRHEVQMQTKLRQVYTLVNATPAEQLHIIAEIKRLPLAVYLQALTVVLQNDWINPLYKSELLSYIAPLDVKQKLAFNWFGQVKTVDLATLPSDFRVMSYQTVWTHLTNMALDDPIILLQIQQELDLQFILLYPFADEVVQAPAVWLDELLLKYEGQTADTGDKPHLQVRRWQDKIDAYIAELNM
ncbi:hypothetical protein ACNAN0_07370 [Agrilactobacillus fermenti]|uniref:hypothetical protein n=1 Tax=Agrilactobacillus fermenti TaxID=2586909 RepID=UPI003A5BF73B